MAQESIAAQVQEVTPPQALPNGAVCGIKEVWRSIEIHTCSCRTDASTGAALTSPALVAVTLMISSASAPSATLVYLCDPCISVQRASCFAPRFKFEASRSSRKIRRTCNGVCYRGG